MEVSKPDEAHKSRLMTKNQLLHQISIGTREFRNIIFEPEIDLSPINLSSDTQKDRFVFDGSEFTDPKFGKIANASFKNIHVLNSGDFSNINLASGADFTGATLENTTWVRTNAFGIIFNNTIFIGITDMSNMTNPTLMKIENVSTDNPIVITDNRNGKTIKIINPVPMPQSSSLSASETPIAKIAPRA